jgi:hypothetical protein
MRRRDFFGIGAVAPVKAAQEVTKTQPPDKNSIEYKVKCYIRMLRRKMADPRWINTQRTRGMPEGFELTPPRRITFSRSLDGDVALGAWWDVTKIKGFKGFCIATVTHDRSYSRIRNEDRRNDEIITRLIAKELGAGFISVTYNDPVVPIGLIGEV